MELDPHTHQINIWIALAEEDPTFSDNLGKRGYRCSIIEDEFYILNDEGEDIINPDLILSSQPAEYAIIVECKSQGVDTDQIQRYLRVPGNESNIVLQGLVEGISPSQLSAEVVFSSFRDLSKLGVPDKIGIIDFREDPSSGLSLWEVDEHQIHEDSASETFPINSKPTYPLPTGHYPFDVYEADKEAMVSAVFSSVVSLSVQNEEIHLDEVMARTHPFWDKIGDEKRREFSQKMERVYHELINSGLGDYLEKIAGTDGKEWRVVSHSIQALQDRTDYYVDQVLDNLPQARLDSDAWKGDT